MENETRTYKIDFSQPIYVAASEITVLEDGHREKEGRCSRSFTTGSSR